MHTWQCTDDIDSADPGRDPDDGGLLRRDAGRLDNGGGVVHH